MKGCIRDDEIAVVAGLAPGDPARAHADACPRCKALVAAYVAFMREPTAEIAQLDAADAALEREIARELALPRARHAPFVRVRASADTGGMRAWWRPAIVAAAAVAVVALVWTVVPRTPEHAGWRGSPDATESTLDLSVAPAAEGRTIALAWPAVQGASSYRVEVIREDLSDLATFDAGELRRHDLRLDALPLAGENPRLLLVQVFALRGETVLARSLPVPLMR